MAIRTSLRPCRAFLVGLCAALITAGLSAATSPELTGTVPPRESPRWSYLFDLGANFVQDNQVTPPDPNYPDMGLGFDPGVRLDAAIQYRALPPLYVGLGSGYTWNEVRSLLGFRSESGGFAQVPVLFEITFHQRIGGRFEGFAGAGVGGIYSELDVTGPPNQGWLTADGSDWTLGAEGRTGLTMDLARGLYLGLAYRYRWTQPVDWEVTFWDPRLLTVRVPIQTHDLHQHAILLFFRAEL